ncbi:collagen binding domain-containing protein [Aeromicrobium sp. UC242_57]|uniref:collagen binding domain-containing protein n=1 Tax=Aeromicrobium sp. UC242_57 TaxID=3374624 RepID=UPI0037B1B934
MTSPSVSDRRPLAARYAIAFVAAMSMVLGPLAFAPAQAAGFTISGTVGGEGAGPLEGVQVELQVYNAQDEYFQSADWAATDELGEYHFDEVESGQSYRVRALSIDNFTRSTSAAFVLTGNKSLSFTLGIGGSLSGSVREAGTNAVIESVDVRAYPIVNGAMVYEDDSAAQVDPETGSFLLQGLEPGNYEVHISDYSGPHVKKIETATVVRNTVTPMGTITLNVGGTFAGTLQDSAGAPVDFASVSALPVVNGEADYSNAYGASIDEVTGAYVIQGLPAGSLQDLLHGIQLLRPVLQQQGDRRECRRAHHRAGGEQASGHHDPREDGVGDRPHRGRVGQPARGHGGRGVQGHQRRDCDREAPASTTRSLTERTSSPRCMRGPTVSSSSTASTCMPTRQVRWSPWLRATSSWCLPPSWSRSLSSSRLSSSLPEEGRVDQGQWQGRQEEGDVEHHGQGVGCHADRQGHDQAGQQDAQDRDVEAGQGHGQATKQKKGKRAYKVIYAGDRKVRAKTVTTKKITIK